MPPFWCYADWCWNALTSMYSQQLMAWVAVVFYFPFENLSSRTVILLPSLVSWLSHGVKQTCWIDFRRRRHICRCFVRMKSLKWWQTNRQCGYLAVMGTNPHYPTIVCSLSTCTYMIGLALPFHLPRCKSLPRWRVHFIWARHAIKGLFV